MGRWVILLALLLCVSTAYTATILVPQDQPTIQAAVNVAGPGDMIVVAAGTYVEQIRIDGKNLTLQGAGAGQSIIEAVALGSRTTYSITQWDGSTRTIDACIGVTGSTVAISGFTVDGKALGPDNFYGVHFYNSDGSVTGCNITNITDAVGTGSSRVVGIAVTHGMIGSCTVDVTSNTLTPFQKGGIVLMGPSTVGTIDNNTVIGGGTTIVAQNGIQISYGATATLTGNQVSMVAYPGTDWAGTGILLFECGDVTVTGGTLAGCEIAIGHSQWNWIYTPPATPTITIDEVTLNQNEWGVTTHLGDAGASLELEVSECIISNTINSGVDLYGSGVDPWGGSYYSGWTNGSLIARVHDNTIVNGEVGLAEVVVIPTGNTVTCAVNRNDLGGNSSHGVYNNFTNMIDATANWWGDASGPGFSLKAADYTPRPRPVATPYAPGEAGVPEGLIYAGGGVASKGSGSPVSSAVDYSPWWGGNYLDDPHTTSWNWCVDPTNGSTIMEGVNVASAGDEVYVYAGTYEEQVVIAKPMTLAGVDKAQVTLQSPPSLPQYFTTAAANHPIIYVNSADVDISDLSIDGLARGNNNYRFVGIGFWNAGGSVTNVDITGVRDDPFSGQQHGVSIYAFNNTGGPYYLDITDVAVTDIQKAGIVLGGGGLVATVTGCSVTGVGPTAITAQNGIQVGFGANGTITDCTVANVAYTGGDWGASGILFYEAANGAVATGSLVSGSQAAIVFHETSGSANGATVTPSGTNDEEGVSVRDYGNVKATTMFLRHRMASPLEDPYVADDITKAAVTVVTLSNLVLNGVGTAGSYGAATWALGETAITTLLDSDIQGWDVGVVAYDDGAAASVTASHNRIYNNTFGFWTNSAFGAMAERNYWGSDHGPTHPTNPNGDGDEVTDFIDYEPWCNYDFTICDLTVGCCIGRVGDANGIGGDEPTIGDVTALVDMLFVSQQPVACIAEADINQSGGFHPVAENVTIGDVTELIDYLFITGPAVGILPDCM
ncbi:MAG: NosD domain-containing protein [Candidatus Zixiibacteriota bacterium]